MSKKILSLALALVMLMSAFSIVASAEFALDSIGIRVETNATVGMGEGEDVEVKVYYTVPDGVDLTDYLHGLSQIVIAYTDAFKLNTSSPNSTASYDARTWGDSYAEYLSETSIVNTKTALYTTMAKNFTDNDKAKGWDSVVIVAQANNSDNGYTAKSGYPIDLDCEIFTLSFTTTRTVTEDDNFGVPESSVTKNQTKMYYISAAEVSQAQYGKNLDTIILDEAVAYPGAAEDPANPTVPDGDLTGVTGKMRINGADRTKVDLGYIGSSDYDVDVKAVYDPTNKVICRYDVTNIDAVGFQASVNGGAVITSSATKIYLNGSTDGITDEGTVTGGFNFLPCITAADEAILSSTIKLRTYIIVDGQYICSDWVELDANTTYANAIAAGMADIFA